MTMLRIRAFNGLAIALACCVTGCDNGEPPSASRAGSEDPKSSKLMTESEEQSQKALPNPPDPDIMVQMGVAIRAQFRLGPEIARIADGKVDNSRLLVIREVLRHTPESFVHRMRGRDGNVVFLASDGREAVYDHNGHLVQDGVNDGTFNYADWTAYPLEHFVCDMSPWLLLGLSESDPTELSERVHAYVCDLETGVRGARNAFREGLADESFEIAADEYGRIECLAIMLRVIDEAQADDLYPMVRGDRSISERAMIDLLTRLERAFNTVYTGVGG